MARLDPRVQMTGELWRFRPNTNDMLSFNRQLADVCSVDLLQQFELFTVATDIVKRSASVREVYELTRTSTRVNTSCTGCSRPLSKAGWHCDRCNGYVHVCSLW